MNDSPHPNSFPNGQETPASQNTKSPGKKLSRSKLREAIARIQKLESQVKTQATTAAASTVFPGSVAALPDVHKTPTEITAALSQISLKMTGIIDSLASLNRAIKSGRSQETLDVATASSAPVAPSICARCIIKGGYFREVAHLCKKLSVRNACLYCTSQHTKCPTIPQSLWGEAEALSLSIAEAQEAFAVDGDPSVFNSTIASGKVFSKTLATAQKLLKKQHDSKQGSIETRLDRLYGVMRLSAQIQAAEHVRELA